MQNEFFIKLKFVSKTALTNFRNISDKNENLIPLTITLKDNIKRHDEVITTSNDRLKKFKNVRRKFFENKNKNLNVKKKF